MRNIPILHIIRISCVKNGIEMTEAISLVFLGFIIIVVRLRRNFYVLISKIVPASEVERSGYEDEAVVPGKEAVLEEERITFEEVKRIRESRVKRVYDLVISVLAMLIICSWLFPLIALLIKLTSRGPVFFRQARKGEGGKVFEILKFRTMREGVTSVDSEGYLVQAKKEDERVTVLGKFLRKSSLDEFPQFLNVIKGDMSLVGPRPHPVELDKYYEIRIDGYNERYKIKPGITGLSQITGLRGETPEDETMARRVRTDLRYIKNWSFLLDLKISLNTFLLLLKGDIKAY